MSYAGPFGTAVGLVERTPNLIDVMIPDDPMVDAYRLWQHRTVNDAYGNPVNSQVGGAGPVQIIEVEKGLKFRSPTILRKRWGLIEESRVRQTRIVYDPDDYDTPPGDAIRFVRVQERRHSVGGWLEVTGPINNGDPILGPLYAIPTPRFFGTQIPTLVTVGNAPANTGCVFGSVPVLDETVQNPPPLHLIMPRTCSSFTIHNFSTTTRVLVSMGMDQQMTYVETQDDMTIFGTPFKDFVIASEDNGGGAAVAPEFSVHAVVALDLD